MLHWHDVYIVDLTREKQQLGCQPFKDNTEFHSELKHQKQSKKEDELVECRSPVRGYTRK